MAAALDWSLDTPASISWRKASVHCAPTGTLASGIGVGAGVGFAGEAEACWLGPGMLPDNLSVIVRSLHFVLPELFKVCSTLSKTWRWRSYRAYRWQRELDAKKGC